AVDLNADGRWMLWAAARPADGQAPVEITRAVDVEGLPQPIPQSPDVFPVGTRLLEGSRLFALPIVGSGRESLRAVNVSTPHGLLPVNEGGTPLPDAGTATLEVIWT